MLTTSQTQLAAAYWEGAGVLCLDCLRNRVGLWDKEDLLFWMASHHDYTPIIEYSLDDYADGSYGLYCNICESMLVEPYCPECGGPGGGGAELCSGCEHAGDDVDANEPQVD